MIAETSAIQSAAGGLKAAGDIIRALIGMKVTAEVQQKVIELQTVIVAAQSDAMSAQSAQFELLGRVRELEGNLKRFEDWETEKQRYALTTAAGCRVYAVKKAAMQPGEPAHAVCPTCYERGKKRILQPTPRTHGARDANHACPECRTVFPFWQTPGPIEDAV